MTDAKPDPKPRDKSEKSLDRQIEDSFPASDPPSTNAPKRVGRPDPTPSKGQTDK